jgi:uncharacterized repeat protein (TIGR04138 family)
MIMSFRDDLARVIAGSSRHSIEAYAFVLEALQFARSRKLKALARDRKAAGGRRTRPSHDAEASPLGQGKSKSKPSRPPQTVGHVTGQEFCESARRLALRQYGFLARTVLESWGIRSTADMGEVVYSLIASGHLEKTPRDRRSDFKDVYDFATAFRPTLAAIARDAQAGDADFKPGI